MAEACGQLIAIGLIWTGMFAWADEGAYEKTFVFNIPQLSADIALTEFAEQADLTVAFPGELVRSRSANALVGAYTLQQGIEVLLNGTGLVPTFNKALVLSISTDTDSRTKGETMKIRKSSRLAAVLGFLLTGAEAQEPIDGEGADKSKANALEEIVVTASRREQDLQDVPMAITAVLPEDFVAVGITNVSDMIDYVPGFNFSNITGGPRGKGTITARGVGQQGRAAVVGAYVDDVPVTGSGLFGSIFYLDGVLGDIERIEFLKGPQGTLYGASSIGGAVRYITRKPSLEGFRGTLTSSLSSTKDGGFNQLYAARISTPVIDEKLGISVGGHFEDNAGFVDRVEAGSGTLDLEDADKFDSYSVGVDLLYNPSDKLQLRVKVLDQAVNYDGLSVVNVDANLKPVYRGRAGDDALSSNELSNTLYSGTVEYDFSGASLVSTSSYAESGAVRALDATAFYADLIDQLEGNAPGTTTKVPILADDGYTKFSQEIRLVSENDSAWEWLAGVFYTEENIETITSALGEPTGFDLLTESSVKKYEEIAAFGNITYYLTPKLDLTLGSRVSRIKTDSGTASGSGVFYGGDSDAPNVVETTVDTWLFTARYRPGDDASFYARVATGYRPPVALSSQAVDPVTGGSLGRSFIESDSLWSYEFGVKGELVNGRLAYDLALWNIDWEDFQTVLVFGGFTVLANAEGGIRSRGVEGEITFRPLTGVTITSAFGLTDSTLKKDEPGLFGIKGQQLPHIPKWTASIRGRYDFSLFSDAQAYLSGGLRFEDEKRGAFSDDRSLDPHDPSPELPVNGNVNIPTEGYVLADLSAGIIKGPLGVSLFVTNLFDDKSYSGTSALVSPATALFTATAVPVQPRTVGATISIDF